MQTFYQALGSDESLVFDYDIEAKDQLSQWVNVKVDPMSNSCRGSCFPRIHSRMLHSEPNLVH